jgi:hypothetical protein
LLLGIPLLDLELLKKFQEKLKWKYKTNIKVGLVMKI